MNVLAAIRGRFQTALYQLLTTEEPIGELLAMVRPSQDSRFGDYQANCAMPLAGKLSQPARQIAEQIVERLDVQDLCQSMEIAGPGFINLKLNDGWLQQKLSEALADQRLGISTVGSPRTVVVDYSSPNVAKPMHVGHIRSTVIGDALARTLRFKGHRVITDNHLGDWGTQFGMIIYGYKHFLNTTAYQQNPVEELSRLYKLVRRLIDYHDAIARKPLVTKELSELNARLENLKSFAPDDPKKAKQHRKDIEALHSKFAAQQDLLSELEAKISTVDDDTNLKVLANDHVLIGNAVLEETSLLHAGDATNLDLWKQFYPHCQQDIQRIYQRLSVQFDHELGESFYHDQLQDVVDDLEARGFARTSEGAICIFLDDFESPMIVQKKDGAFLYATTDLATIRYRVDNWQAEEVLYVVDHRQHEHFEKLFAVAKLWGYDHIKLTHVSFGTVLGEDGRPYKTRSGDTVGLEGLLDEAESRALEIVKQQNSQLTTEELQNISRVIGVGGLKYADLSQNRATDYKFSYEKMLALKGNTATYLQYSYARVQGILRRLDIDPQVFRDQRLPFLFSQDIERHLGLKLLQFEEAIDEMLVEYKPNILCNYLFELTQTFFQFYDQCSVKDAATEELKNSRLQFCDLTARTIKQGLELLGIGVLEQM